MHESNEQWTQTDKFCIDSYTIYTQSHKEYFPTITIIYINIQRQTHTDILT